MKVNYVTHKSGTRIVPMIIIADNPEAVASDIIKTSEHCSDVLPDWNLEDIDTCGLDPGGMYFGVTPHAKFEIDGIKFDVQYTKAGPVLWHMEVAKERVPGYMRFRMWFWNFVVDKTLFNKLIIKLTEIGKSDSAIHAHISEDEVKAKIEKECPNVRFNIPRE